MTADMRHRWESYIKRILYDYPALAGDLRARRTPSIGSGLAGGSASGLPAKPVERTALRELAPEDQRELDAVEAAISATRARTNGEKRLKIIELVYFRRSHTLNGAALAVHYSYSQTKRMQMEFMGLVAKNLGLRER